jgi:predicted AlkP superfamily pyrophosphatase or phosphodiesterase
MFLVMFWKQSNHLISGERVYQSARLRNPAHTTAKMFWWYNMYSTADFAVTPRPLYPSDGRKLPDIHTQPMELRDRLQQELGQFPLFSFWGPKANIESSKWIAAAAKKVDQWHNPTLNLVYLPHLDYALQKFGIDFDKIGVELEAIDALCEDLISYFESQGTQVLLLSEYGITTVKRPVHLNRVLRKAGLIQVKDELGLETLDAGTSKAFAVADHQLAHVYLNDPSEFDRVKKLLESTPGVELVLDQEGKQKYHLDHERAGDLVVVADSDSWFTYYFWLDDAKAPDYARCVDIHRKPGYDPVEMFLNPAIKFPLLTVGAKVLKKKLGFRYLMDVIPLDATLVKGSHGRIPESDLDKPILVTPIQDIVLKASIQPTQVAEIILKLVRGT